MTAENEFPDTREVFPGEVEGTLNGDPDRRTKDVTPGQISRYIRGQRLSSTERHANASKRSRDKQGVR